DLGETKAANGVLSPDGTRVIAGTADKLTLLDPASGETIWSIDCRLCLRSHLSTDGQRLVTHNGKEIVLWDVGPKLSLWRDSRAGSLSEPVAMSSDGRRVAWGSSKGVYLRAEGAGDQELQLQGDVVELAFDESGDRLAVLSSLSTDVYAVEGLHPIFRTPNSSWMEEDVHWSNDDSALIVWRGSGGPILSVSSTGEPFAAVEKVSSSARASSRTIPPDLRYTISEGNGFWSLEKLPPPDDAPPADSLARILRESGFEMRGVELVYAAGAR